MRLPVDINPPVAITENRYQIRQPDSVNAVKAIAPNASSRQGYYRKRDQKSGQGSSQGSGQGNSQQATEEQLAEERRNTDRRVGAAPVILDTRTGQDRRANGESGGLIDELA